MQAAQSYQALVVDTVVEVALSLLYERVDLFESFQIPYGRRQEQSEDHVDVVGESFSSFLLIAHEVDHHIGLVIAHGNGDITLVYDAQRDCSVRSSASYLLDIGNTQNDEHPAVVIFVAGTLIGIADVGKEVVGNIEFLFQ